MQQLSGPAGRDSCAKREESGDGDDSWEGKHGGTKHRGCAVRDGPGCASGTAPGPPSTEREVTYLTSVSLSLLGLFPLLLAAGHMDMVKALCSPCAGGCKHPTGVLCL